MKLENPLENSKGPDRRKLIQEIRNIKPGSPEMQKAVAPYWEYLDKHAEKETGRGNILVSLEMAKLYRDAGFIIDAIEILVGQDDGLIVAAEELGFWDLRDLIDTLADGWRDETIYMILMN